MYAYLYASCKHDVAKDGGRWGKMDEDGASQVLHQVLRFQLTDLKYDSQIASAMLARQQATAQVDAKRALVHGAAETASSTVNRLKQLGHSFSSENEQRLIHDLLLKNLDPDYKARSTLMSQQP